MKYAKMLGLLALAAAALMAFAGSASATTLTGAGGSTIGVGTVIHAEVEGIAKLDGSLVIECSKSTVNGPVTNAGGSSATASGEVTKLTFDECGSRTVTPISGGTLEIHTGAAGNNGTLTSSGAEVTVLAHLPFNVTTHCIYTTSATDLGTLTGSANTGGTATLDIESAPISRTSTDFGCGSESVWTGNYKVDSPDTLNVD